MLAASTRPVGSGAGDPLIAQVRQHAEAAVLRLWPLTPAAVAELVRE